MEQVDHQLDDRYTNGVWYDSMNGDFAHIQRGFDPDAEGDGRIVELVNPETDSVYWDMSVREWEEEERDNFIEVHNDAVEDPVQYVRDVTDILHDAAQNTGESLPLSTEISFRYARRKTKVVEV